jgi:hypothetical protein
MAAKEMYDSMSEQELEEFASTKRKGKPEHVSIAVALLTATTLSCEYESAKLGFSVPNLSVRKRA